MKKIFNNQSGFTLLEIMIAVSLFTIVLLISTAMFLRSIDAQSRSINSKDLQESFNFALAIMSNEASGALQNPSSCSVSCSDDLEFFCVVDGVKLIFKNASDVCVNYEKVNDDGDPNNVPRLRVTRNGVSDYLTPSSVQLTDLAFTSYYTNDASYPIGRVTMFLKGQSLDQEAYPAILQIQTTASTWPNQ